MKILAIQPFIPSGPDFNQAKEFYKDLGFSVRWDGGDYVGYEKDGCRFILQKFDNREFAENFMLSVAIDDATAFREFLLEKNIPVKYGVRITEVMDQPYGKEVNVIDMAGVCWHFVE